MIDELLQNVAPHYCYGCGKTGTLLCDNCKYNIILEPFSGCAVCQKPTGPQNICKGCKTHYEQAWAVGERSEALRQQRIARAKNAFHCSQKLSLEIPYLLVDDVITTGATIQYVAKTLRDAGAGIVWAAVVAKQPLDQTGMI